MALIVPRGRLLLIDAFAGNYVRTALYMGRLSMHTLPNYCEFWFLVCASGALRYNGAIWGYLIIRIKYFMRITPARYLSNIRREAGFFIGEK